MLWLARICVSRPVFAWVLTLVVVVLGAVSYTGLGLDKFPNADLPTIVVTTTQRGTSPEEIERDITDEIESAVNTISGIDELRSTSSEGVSQVTVLFALEKNADVAAQEVRDRVNGALASLPKGIDPPVVRKYDPGAAPVLYVTLHGPGTIRDLTELADKQVRPEIERLTGVGEVTIVGGTRRQIRVWLDPARLSSYGLTPVDVQRAVERQNFSVPGGVIERGPRQQTLRVDGRVANLEQLRQLPVRASADHTTRLEDVAAVEDGAEDVTTWASYDGERAVVLSIRKQAGANTVAVVNAVRERLDELQRALPTGARLEVVRDNSATIRTSLGAVEEHLILGALLAALVVLVFLGSGRSTVIAGLAIPVSIVGAFALMYVLGFTLNILTLLALALAVGIVIDDAVVVLENIHRFVTVKRQRPLEAAVNATGEIGLAVLATTLSLLAVFVPVAFMSGMAGRFLRSFGLTMAASIAVSFFVSFTLTPMLSARWLRPPGGAGRGGKPWLERVVDRLNGPVERAYLALLRRAMAHRWAVVGLCVLALASIVPLARWTPVSFLPENDDAQFNVSVRTPEGTSVNETRIVADRVARGIRGVPGVVHTLVTVGDGAQRTPNVANVYVKLTDPEDRAVSQATLIDRVRAEVLARQPEGLKLGSSPVADMGGSRAAIQFSITGSELTELARLTESIVGKLRKVPGAVDVDSSLVLGRPQVDVDIDRDRAAALGVDPIDVAQTLQLQVGGLKLSTYAERGESYDIFARAAREYRTDGRLGLITVPSRTAGAVPLESVAISRTSLGPSAIERLNRRRQVTISCNVAAGVGESTVTAALERIIADEHLPAGYVAAPAGNSREGRRTAASFALAFAASLVFMYLVLAAQFESWIHPVTILVCLPLTVPFALVSILIFGQQLTVFSALGLLVLFGVVKKNAILQVDHTIHLRAEGMPRAEAILQANRDRLRPILMTTVAFVAGMLPLLFSRGVGAGLNRGIAGVIVGGQALSLVLTLLATPVVYSLFDDVASWWSRRREPSGPPPG